MELFFGSTNEVGEDAGREQPMTGIANWPI